MQVKITRPIMLGGKTYRPGAHDVQVQDGERWFFDALLASGAVESLQKAAQMPAQTPEAAPQGEGSPAPVKARKTRKKAA